jgi:exonuclease V gamma subunit
MARRCQYSNDFAQIRGPELVAKKKTDGDRERNEEKRTQFIQELGDAKSDHIVYVDESGMLNRQKYCALPEARNHDGIAD